MNFPCSYDLLSAFKNESFNWGDLLARSVSVKSDKVYNGFVKDVATFIVTDDLVVIPNAMDSSFGVLQKFGVKSWSSIQEMTVNVTKKKVIFDTGSAKMFFIVQVNFDGFVLSTETIAQ
ncbi:hypothetical protein JHK87_018375 [Glycine soja]|nr:hypothetical protein JHK87_018375 [Glycine soja]